MNLRKRDYGTVVGPHPRTAESGFEMLLAGGNAVDAAVAAAFAEGVVEPSHNGIAGYGGCVLIYRKKTQDVIAIDYNTAAPAAASENMFTIEDAPDAVAGYRVPGRVNVHGPQSIGVPGVVAGLCLALEEFGSLPLADVVRPAINSARYGYAPNSANRGGIAGNAERWKKDFPETARVFLKDGRAPKKGERLTNPELARTLETVAEGGREAFYEGTIAATIANHIQELGGCLTIDDLKNYRPFITQPYEIQYRGYSVYTAPLGAGGLTTLQMLRLVEEFDMVVMSVAERFHLFAEAMKVCWPERLRRFGDPEFVDIDIETELSDSLITTLKEKLQAGLKSPQPGEVVYYEPMNCTSHISTADAEGNMVSLTQTHGGGFGSMVTVPGTGLLFGHGVGRFDPRPGIANSIGPGKRPLHNMAPFLATREGMPFATYGIPGGRTIPNNQLNISVSLMDLQVPIQAALDAPRLHTDGAEPIQVEPRAGEETLTALQKLGHEITPSAGIGGPGHGIRLWEDGNRHDGGTDPRGEGKMMGK